MNERLPPLRNSPGPVAGREGVHQERRHNRTLVELFVDRVVDPGENLQYFYAFITDISSHREAEETLKKSATRHSNTWT